ncbi:MAG: fumarylacetoacetate hydrolase family protein [Spirochaetes bacterium]|nr:fumarylacetoacetate hydrolase family protein [Spirochaetota bacterium]
MKIVRFLRGKETVTGILEDGRVFTATGDIYGGLKIVEKNPLPVEEAALLPPVVPSKVVAVGLNYRDHAEELGSPIPSEPILFMKPSTSVIGPEDSIVHPSACNRMDYEAELALVVKEKAYRVSEEDAPRFILGYTCCNDVTARDLQTKDGQWTRAKSFDTFCPIGPVIETEIDPLELSVVSRLNGETRQSSNTRQFIFPVFELFSFISHIMTLLPGDVITTGTPSGIGAMKPGDTVEVEVEGIGVLRNAIVAERARPSD